MLLALAQTQTPAPQEAPALAALVASYGGGPDRIEALARQLDRELTPDQRAKVAQLVDHTASLAQLLA